jgi:hypothetical protein
MRYGIILVEFWCFLSYNPFPAMPEYHNARGSRFKTFLDLDSRLKSLALLLSASIGLSTHDTTTPVSLSFLVLLTVTLLDGLNQLRQFRLVLRSDLSQSNNSSGLLVDDRAESCLALDDSIRNTHLTAEGWQEDDQLNGVNIVGDEDQSCLLVLNQADDMVETILGSIRLLRDVFLLLALLDGGGLLQQTLLLLGLALGAVLVEELESLCSGVSVEDVLELGNRGWDLETEVQDLLLALQTDIFGPLHHTGEVATRLDVLTDAIVTGALLDERVLPLVSNHKICRRLEIELTFGAFFDPAPAFDWGNGAGAAFFPALGGYH